MRRSVERGSAPVSASSGYHGHPGSAPSGSGKPNATRDGDDEGVEVVLAPDQSPKPRDQSIFRPPQAPPSSTTVRPRAMRVPPQHHRGAHPPPPVQSSGSYGYPPRGDYYPPRPPQPMQVPYSQSGSFDEGYAPPPPQPPPPPPPPPATTQHYSPHVHYPQPGRSSDVNVISPNHKPDPYRPPRGRHVSQAGFYQYPPASPVSRPPNAPHGANGPHRSSRGGHYPQAYHPDDGTFNRYPNAPEHGHPPVVAESSFDSENYTSSQNSHYSSKPPTPAAPYDGHAQQQFYGGGGSWGSFDTAPQQPPPYEDYRYYGYPYPDSPYSSYHQSPDAVLYYPGDQYSPHHPHYDPRYEDDEHRMLREYHPDADGYMNKGGSPATEATEVTSNKSHNGIVLPEAAREVDFEVTNPPMEPVVPPSEHPLVESQSLINSNDVLLGRGGGTNSQIGNRRFRKLVHDFQPTYLLARRKEKPLLARTIVIIIRKRGGRFLKKDEDTGELYEVGDVKAEAKTSQALREGLDVRATKNAANSMVDKNKKKKKKGKGLDGETETEPTESPKEESKEESEDPKTEEVKSPVPQEPAAAVTPASEPRAKTPPRPENLEDDGILAPESPPALPRLAEENKAGIVHPHSPEAFAFRKRRRMRSGEGCIPFQDKLFPDFCPPRADLARTTSPDPEDQMQMADTPPRRNHAGTARGQGDDSVQVEDPQEDDFPETQGGCAGIAMSIMTGAATGSFCLGPTKWGKRS